MRPEGQRHSGIQGDCWWCVDLEQPIKRGKGLIERRTAARIRGWFTKPSSYFFRGESIRGRDVELVIVANKCGIRGWSDISSVRRNAYNAGDCSNMGADASNHPGHQFCVCARM